MLSLKKKKSKESKVFEDHFKDELMMCKTLEEFLEVCGEFYDLKNCKLSNFQLSAMVGNIDKLITVSGAKPKK